MLVIYDILQTFDKPSVYLCQFVDALYAVTLFQSLCDSEDTEVCRVCKFFVKILELSVVIAYKSVHALTNHTETLLDEFFERTTYTHDLTDRLHAGTYLTAYTCKLSEVPTRNLTNQVVERRSYIC